MNATPTIPDAGRIAAGLTEAQRRAIVRSNEHDEIDSADDDFCEDLEALGITGEEGWIDRLTPLGLAVKDHLTPSAEQEESR